MTNDKLIGTYFDDTVLLKLDDKSRDLYDKSRYGSIVENSLNLSILEALYLVEKQKLIINDKKNKELSVDDILKKAKKKNKNFWTNYCVFKDFRNRGYIIKTALKYGAEFRVYDRGVKPGDDHAKWVVYPVNESEYLTWYEFSAKNRVAHSTRKRLLIAVVDDESSVIYYEVKWVRP